MKRYVKGSYGIISLLIGCCPQNESRTTSGHPLLRDLIEEVKDSAFLHDSRFQISFKSPELRTVFPQDIIYFNNIEVYIYGIESEIFSLIYNPKNKTIRFIGGDDQLEMEGDTVVDTDILKEIVKVREYPLSSNLVRKLVTVAFGWEGALAPYQAPSWEVFKREGEKALRIDPSLKEDLTSFQKGVEEIERKVGIYVEEYEPYYYFPRQRVAVLFIHKENTEDFFIKYY